MLFGEPLQHGIEIALQGIYAAVDFRNRDASNRFLTRFGQQRWFVAADELAPERVARVLRLAQLEEDLNLRPAQLPLWHAYRDRVLGLLDDVRRAGRAAASESSAPQRLDALADIARNRLTATEDIADAGKALYKALTPEQREVADRRLALPLMTLNGNDPGSDLRLRAAPKPPAPDK